MKLRAATAADLAFIVTQEQRPDYAGYIVRWPRAVHESKLTDPGVRYLIAERDDGTPAGYAILTSVASPHRSIELTRIVMAQPGCGEGRTACRAVLAVAFGELRAHRVALDVFEGNVRALNLYRSLGFRREGVLREAVHDGGRFRSLIVMSLLAHEYRAGSPGDGSPPGQASGRDERQTHEDDNHD
jgi:RimJ/RimL family protein N-acetyltransferase